MRVTANQLKNGFVQFIDNVIMPRSDSYQKFGITFFLLANQKKIDDIIQNLGILDEKGEFDLDEIFDYASQALEKAGGSLNIPKINWNFDKDDLTKIYNILKGDTYHGT